ncbi:MAG: helix-hairpin-helix domain-containing protein [Candidatus Nitrosopumilus limneticus]|nr:Heavy metal resistance protein CzcA [Candidatus Nitrosopumilus limneticus]MDC4211675.1 helix-hairpin-helix domain-containing protein [Candidatus Nitrosopumilus limneticus]MDC4213018.1 helix-hairpin-helix domain-containing protein [Candidatus Nitrosopumilus limneticus]MDC4214617.1 helix-hairpin-helix domain-containing protein [Candidatus Nitrosopumilus limneticus]MDC4215323.1 helix-hairpin-helix domain-containing protein [Candidatus Nitrosopumilus limneticus]
MKLENLRIIVDERERKSGIPELLKAIGMEIEMKTLSIGDYIVAPETIVERKSIKDLMASVFDGRLYDQCNRLKEHFEHPIVVVEGNVDEIEEITDNPLVFYGALSRIALEFKIPIIPTPSASHTAKLLVSMCSKKDGSTGPYLKKIKKSSNLETQQLSTLCSLPGIGEKLAVRMLEKFGTPLKVFSATTSELSKVEGLGEARAKKIKNMLITKNKLQKESNQKTLT